MRIKTLTLKNFRGFKDTEISFSEGLTVLVGVNGAGKSSVLDALAMMLSLIADDLRQTRSFTWSPREVDIHQGANEFSVEAQVHFEDREFEWMLGLYRDGHSVAAKFDIQGFKDFAAVLREHILNPGMRGTIPVMVYYPVNRVVTHVPVPPPEDASCFDLMESYRDSMPTDALDFHLFFKWFRAREDLENERRLRGQIALDARDRDLEVVRQAIKVFLPGLTSPMVKRFPETLVVEKNGLELPVDRLSDGEKLLIALAGDLARRIALVNPSMENPLQGEGVVLIDEIEQHLHPKWQREIIGNLQRTFPNVQFIVSTHSPQVLGEVNHEDIRILDNDPERGQQAYIPSRSLGLDSSSILEEIFDTGRRNTDVKDKLTAIFDLIDADSFERAREEIDALERELGANIPELIKARTMIAMLEGIGAEY